MMEGKARQGAIPASIDDSIPLSHWCRCSGPKVVLDLWSRTASETVRALAPDRRISESLCVLLSRLLASWVSSAMVQSSKTLVYCTVPQVQYSTRVVLQYRVHRLVKHLATGSAPFHALDSLANLRIPRAVRVVEQLVSRY